MMQIKWITLPTLHVHRVSGLHIYICIHTSEFIVLKLRTLEDLCPYFNRYSLTISVISLNSSSCSSPPGTAIPDNTRGNHHNKSLHFHHLDPLCAGGGYAPITPWAAKSSCISLVPPPPQDTVVNPMIQFNVRN